MIEKDARRFVADVISADVFLTQAERKGTRDEQAHARKQVIDAIGRVNAVANIEGKGRDDFNENTLRNADRLVEQQNTKAVSALARNVKTSFNAVRLLSRQFNNSIETVDPQLRKNEALVKVLKMFEDSWSLAREFLDDSEQLRQLSWFSAVLEQKQTEYEEFREQIDCRDAAIFISIPSLLVHQAAIA